MSSLSDHIKALPDFAGQLKDAAKYWGHIHEEREPELLAEHIGLVMHYFQALCQAHGIDKVVDQLLDQLLEGDLQNKEEVKEALKEMFVQVPYFHDHGKINENFQSARLKNPSFRTVKNELGYHHSLLGAYQYMVFFLNKYGQSSFPAREKGILLLTAVAFSYPIIKHHSAHLGKMADALTLEKSQVKQMQHYLQPFGIQVPDSISLEVMANLQQVIIKHWAALQLPDFPLYALVKLSFSLLTAADYYATAHYMGGWGDGAYEGFGTIDAPLRLKIVAAGLVLQDYNRYTYQNLESILKKPLSELQEVNNKNLNALRGRMAAEVITQVRAHTHQYLFYLEAPTGGGKTNMSMLAVAELLQAHQDLNKVFYVFPFTTLITQTHKAILETLGLQEDEVTQLHAKGGWQSKNKVEDAEDADASYGREHQNFIDNQFVNYPFCLLSHVRFFEILCTDAKERNYLLHRLANAVVVIDELQSYSPEQWDKVIYFVDRYASSFNMRFILMSATLPKLDNLRSAVETRKFIHLLPDAISRFFQNPNFRDRVSFSFELLQNPHFQQPHAKDTEARQQYLENLEHFLCQKTRERKQQQEKPVRTVIEFIFKKTASQFYQQSLGQLQTEYDQIFLLSGTILEPRRVQIINYLKSKQHVGENILLITTQVIEAGVDIDMDLGFKDVSLIDSEEQLAGRINRNVNKKNCKLYLFNLDAATVIYGKDYRYQEQEKQQFQQEYKRVLEEKAFDELYLNVFSKIDKSNTQTYLKGFLDYKEYLRFLDFREASKNFKLIDQENISVFVPIAIPVAVEGVKEGDFASIFSEEELHFLQQFDIYPQEYPFEKGAFNAIDGQEVFALYERWVRREIALPKDFVLEKIMAKRLKGVLSKFVFSIYAFSKTTDFLKQYGSERFGYFYLENTEIYSFEDGIQEKAELETIFL